MTIGVIGMMSLLATARPASAQWNIIKWLEELSGPGYFVLYGGEVHVGCVFDKVDVKISGTGPKGLRVLFCDQNRTPVDSRQVWEKTRFFVAIQAAGGTGTNPLEYPAGEKKDRTSVFTFGGGPVFRLCPALDVGASVGVAKFSGSTSRSVTKAVIDPYVVIRPLVKAPEDLRQYFALRINATIFPQGFTLEDFGATAGSLDGKAEVVFQLGFVFNLAYLGWK